MRNSGADALNPGPAVQMVRLSSVYSAGQGAEKKMQGGPIAGHEVPDTAERSLFDEALQKRRVFGEEQDVEFVWENTRCFIEDNMDMVR